MRCTINSLVGKKTKKNYACNKKLFANQSSFDFTEIFVFFIVWIQYFFVCLFDNSYEMVGIECGSHWDHLRVDPRNHDFRSAAFWTPSPPTDGKSIECFFWRLWFCLHFCTIYFKGIIYFIISLFNYFIISDQNQKFEKVKDFFLASAQIFFLKKRGLEEKGKCARCASVSYFLCSPVFLSSPFRKVLALALGKSSSAFHIFGPCCIQLTKYHTYSQGM